MKSKNSIVLSVLVVIALVLGIALYLKKHPATKAPAPTTPSAETTKAPGELTADQKILFSTPSATASNEELATFSATVAKYAKPGDSITIKDCTATPEVLKLKYGSKFTVNNTGTSDIHFGFGEERTLVPAGKSATITANYSHGPGTYGYGCDSPNLNRAIGLLLLTS